MRKVTLICHLLCLLAVYLLACGALDGVRGAGATGPHAGWDGFLERVAGPLDRLTPLAWGILGGAAVLFAAGVLAVPEAGGNEGGRFDWGRAVGAAFPVNALVLGGIVVLLFADSAGQVGSRSLGLLFVAGLAQAALGAAMAVALVFLPRSRLAYLPSLAVFLGGSGSLGVLYWMGSAAPA